MDAVILAGPQATGKTTFFAQRFLETHSRVSLDLLRTRNRESLFVDLCIRTQMRFVVDNINVLPTSPMDDDIRLSVARAIYGNSTLSKYAIDPQKPIRIVVDNGHVTLYGVVDNQMDKQIAEMQAKSVPNVFSVDNKLMVAGGK